MGKKKSLKPIKKAFGTQEWADYTANFINGCSNDCNYCYAKAMAIRFKRNTPNGWCNEKVNFKKFKVVPRKKLGKVMFPSSHDITPANLNDSLVFLKKLLDSYTQVLIVSKPHLSVIKTICDKFHNHKEQITFRFSIGSTSNSTLKFWEPNAPSFNERLDSLKYAYNAGYRTSVSGEPMLDTNVDDLVQRTLPYVNDAIWIGKPNMLKQRLKTNGADDPLTLSVAKKLIIDQDDNWVHSVFQKYKDNTKIKWKSNFKKVIGLQIPTQYGLDI
jgi:DNA repair photolyase